MRKFAMLLGVLFLGSAAMADAQPSVQQCVEKHVREMMDEVRKSTSNQEVLAMMEADIRSNSASFREDCQKEAAFRAAPPPAPQAPVRPPATGNEYRTEPAPAKPGTGIGLGRKPASTSEPALKDGDFARGSGEKSLHGEGMGTSGDFRTTRTDTLIGSYEFKSGLIDRSGSLAVVPVTITVINKTGCVLHADGALTLNLNTPDANVFSPFTYSGQKIRPFGTFRTVVRVRLENEKKHTLHGMVMDAVVHECPAP